VQNPSTVPSAGRFQWIDSARGMAILWIAFFHCFIAYGGRYPWPMKLSSFATLLDQRAPDSLFGKFSCVIEGIIAGMFQWGSLGVGVFLILSGFGLAYSLARKGGGEPSWRKWYRQRFIRLLPIYWFAHLVFLISPFQYQHDPIDYRFILSFLGDRVFPVSSVFYYLVPAWWFIGLLLQLYIIFPILFRLMQRFGSIRFLGFCIVLTCIARYLIFIVLQANGNYIQGAFFACKLWEFATGMVFGKLIAENPKQVTRLLFSWKSFFAGVIVFSIGHLCYQPDFPYIFSDGLRATGLSIVIINAAAWIDRIPYIGKAFATAGIYSYGIYLFHQPYTMYFGQKLIPYQIGMFIILATPMIVSIAIASMGVEYTADKLTRRYLSR
jgi:peptidoglycan/LPS O-acetylase OafA/YrhL